MTTTTQAAKPLAGLDILIIEDETIVAIVLEELLAEAGAQTTLAETIEEANAALRTHSFDGVLLDINLHGETSRTIAEDLIARSIPFIVMTGSDSRDGDPPALRTAPRLLKPFNRAELLRRVPEVFRGGTTA